MSVPTIEFHGEAPGDDRDLDWMGTGWYWSYNPTAMIGPFETEEDARLDWAEYERFTAQCAGQRDLDWEPDGDWDDLPDGP